MNTNKEETRFREAFYLLWVSIKVMSVKAAVGALKCAVWCMLWMYGHKLITALVISVGLNIALMVTHMQDAYSREHQRYVNWQLEEKYDSLRMANVRWGK